MADTLSLENQGKLLNQGADSIAGAARMQAATQAAQMFKTGDVKGAISTIASVDPDHATALLGLLGKIDPATIQSISGAKSQGALPGQLQLQGLKNSGALAVANVKANAPKASDQVVRPDINSPTGFSRINKKTGAYNQVNQPNLPQPQDNMVSDATGGQSPVSAKPNLRPNQDVDSNGQITTITPGQRKIIDGARKAFDGETKDIVKGLESAHAAQGLTESNNAGGEPLERLRLLRTVTPRPTQQEFQAFGSDMGAIDTLENKLQKLGNGKMTPEIQKDYLNIINLMTSKLSNEYDAHLKNAVERNPEVDPLILKKRLVGASGPTSYQQITKKVSELPAEAQALFNWAHDNPSDPRSSHYLKQLSDKYKLGQ